MRKRVKKVRDALNEPAKVKIQRDMMATLREIRNGLVADLEAQKKPGPMTLVLLEQIQGPQWLDLTLRTVVAAWTIRNTSPPKAADSAGA